MKKKTLILSLTAIIAAAIMLFSSCALIVAGKYSGGDNLEVKAEGAFELKGGISGGKLTYKGKDSKGNEIDYSGEYKVDSRGKGRYDLLISGTDSISGEDLFYGVQVYTEGTKQILVYWDGNDMDAYVYKK